jgi:hypothetical protein
MYNKIIVTICCFFILVILLFSSIVIAKENENGKPDLCEKFEDKKDKWEEKWKDKEEEDKEWGDKWEEKRENKIEKLDVLKDKFCDECDDNDDGDNGNGGDDNGNGGDSNNIKTSFYSRRGNIPPVADTSAGEPYIGFINENIEFNGSFSFDPDGYIVDFIWEFSDDTVQNGEIVIYSFSEEGDYDVFLTVVDNNGAINTSFTIVSIVQPNNPPAKPSIDGNSIGFVDSLYDFSVLSYDLDDDDISYYVDWGDGVNINSQFVKNGTEMIFQYSWNKSGLYTINVKAFDGNSFSDNAEFIIEIGVYQASVISDILLFLILVVLLISIYLILAHRNKEKPKKL